MGSILKSLNHKGYLSCSKCHILVRIKMSKKKRIRLSRIFKDSMRGSLWKETIKRVKIIR